MYASGSMVQDYDAYDKDRGEEDARNFGWHVLKEISPRRIQAVTRLIIYAGKKAKKEAAQ